MKFFLMSLMIFCLIETGFHTETPGTVFPSCISVPARFGGLFPVP